MRKMICILLICFVLLIQNLPIYAQSLKINAGTPITIICEEEIDADNVQLNQNIDFVVQEPVYINNKVAIKAGTTIIGQVTKLKNNSILGIPGEIQIGNFQLLNSNNVIHLRGTLINKGVNRTWVNVGWFLWVAFPVLFIKGGDGKIAAGTFQVLYTVGENYINVDSL